MVPADSDVCDRCRQKQMQAYEGIDNTYTYTTIILHIDSYMYLLTRLCLVM